MIFLISFHVIKKIFKFYKWKPKKNVNDIIKDTYNWMINNKSKISKYI